MADDAGQTAGGMRVTLKVVVGQLAKRRVIWREDDIASLREFDAIAAVDPRSRSMVFAFWIRQVLTENKASV